MCNESEIIFSFKNFTTLTDFFTFLVSMSMIKNPFVAMYVRKLHRRDNAGQRKLGMNYFEMEERNSELI